MVKWGVGGGGGGGGEDSYIKGILQVRGFVWLVDRIASSSTGPCAVYKYKEQERQKSFPEQNKMSEMAG